MRHLKKIREINGGEIKEQDVPSTWGSPQACNEGLKHRHFFNRKNFKIVYIIHTEYFGGDRKVVCGTSKAWIL